MFNVVPHCKCHSDVISYRTRMTSSALRLLLTANDFRFLQHAPTTCEAVDVLRVVLRLHEHRLCNFLSHLFTAVELKRSANLELFRLATTPLCKVTNFR